MTRLRLLYDEDAAEDRWPVDSEADALCEAYVVEGLRDVDCLSKFYPLVRCETRAD